jgi:tetratricopeptide (TPR) repeat protein
VSAVPNEIGGIGSTMQKLRVSPGFDPLKAQVGPEEYFLLSRIDGNQTLREVLLQTGLPVERAVAIVTKLRSIGALLLPNETTAPVPAAIPQPQKPARQSAATPAAPITPPRGVAMGRPRTPTLPRQVASGTGSPPGAIELDLKLADPTPDELQALSETNELDDHTRRRILAMQRLVAKRDPWALLGVPHGADSTTLKRAYFRLSKDIHPDRFYVRQLGSFEQRLATVFEAVSRAYDRLTNPEKSGAHRVAGSGATIPEETQTPQDYASELFDRACALEVGGDALGAMKLFSAAIRIDPQTRYLRRSASCALAANQPRTALEHAKKAQARSPSDPSLARLLATSFKACGKLADAEEVLVMAMALKSENDALAAELRNDLAEVRRLMNG